jgi:REP element-mobilizing transposase RayT
MSQSLYKNYVHLVFSTKHRQHLIHPPYEEELHAYMGGICKRLECQPIKIGGYTNHVHILCMLSKKITLMKLMEEIKSHSSKWMKTLDPSLKNFYWQDGYGAFSVSPWYVEKIIAYIENQHSHHSKKAFEAEYINILQVNSVEYDERFVWD